MNHEDCVKITAAAGGDGDWGDEGFKHLGVFTHCGEKRFHLTNTEYHLKEVETALSP